MMRSPWLIAFLLNRETARHGSGLGIQDVRLTRASGGKAMGLEAGGVAAAWT